MDRQARNNFIMFKSIITTENQPVSSKMDVNMQETEFVFDHSLTEKNSGGKKDVQWVFCVLELQR